PYYVFSVLLFALGTYLSLDTALGATTAIGAPSDPPEALRSISLFVVLTIWPLACVLIYAGLMTYIVVAVLHEYRPMLYYALSGFFFVLSQLAWFLLGRVLCTVGILALFFEWLRVLYLTSDFFLTSRDLTNV
ncbi:hypothetical protein H0H93_008909, partial [Arthromyces matolae]